MKKCIASTLFIVMLLPFVLNTGCSSGPDMDRAKKRVDAILKGITQEEEGGPVLGDEETAISYYWADKPRIMDHDLLNHASDEFDNWRKEMDIFPYIAEYTIEGAVIIGTDVIVYVTIEGDPMSIRVPEKGPVTWSDHEREDQQE